MIARRRTLRRTTVALLPPIAFFLCGGPTASTVFAAQRTRRERLLEIARNQGIDPELLLDPQAYAQRQQAAAKARRQAALQKLPHPALSKEQQQEMERVREKQLPHTLGGWVRDAASGHERALPKNLPPALAPALRRAAAASPAERARLVAPPRRRAPRRSSPPPAARIHPRTTARASWRENPLRALGGRLQYIRQHGLPTGPAVAPRGVLPILTSFLQMALGGPTTDDTAPTPETLLAPEIVAKAQELGHDPLRLYNFVHDTIETEVYYGSKKGALGTLREGAGNDFDQASLLIALLRASGIAARYEYSVVRLTPAQAESYAGTETVAAAVDALASAGVPVEGQAQGSQWVSVQMEHAFVRAWVPYTNYRGLAGPGARELWVSLDPSVKRSEALPRVDVSAVAFDFAGYLALPANPPPKSPLETYEQSVRDYIRQNNLECATLDGAMVRRKILADRLPLLPGTPPVERVTMLQTFAAVPSDFQHTVTFEGPGIQVSETVARLWGKRLDVHYTPDVPEDEPWSVQVAPVLQLEDDTQPLDTGTAVSAGMPQTLTLRFGLPGRGDDTVDHALLAGGRYAIGLDAGKVPEVLLAERRRKLGDLSGDEQETEKLHVAALSYLRDQELARDEAAGLRGGRTFQDTEETLVGIEPKVTMVDGVPVSIAGHYGVMDAARIHAGYYGVAVADSPLQAEMAKLHGIQSSYLEHNVLQRFIGSPGYSAVKLVEQADLDVNDPITSDNAATRIPALNISQDLKDQIQLQVDRGRKVWAPQDPQPPQGDIPELYGFIGLDEATGEGLYAVNSLFGGVGGTGGTETGTAGCGGGRCPPETGPGASAVHLFSGNYTDTITDLTLPAKGIPVVFARTYNAQLGWTHNYLERLEQLQGTGTPLTYVDDHGISWEFQWDAAAGEWTPPPKLFQHIAQLTDGSYEMTFKDGLVHAFDASGRLVAQRDLNGHEIGLSYYAPPDGRLHWVTAGASTLEFAYTTTGWSVTDSAGRSVSFSTDTAGRIVTETDVLGHTRHYTYDASTGWMRTKTALRDDTIVWKMDYDDHGRLVRIEDAEGGVRSYAYDFAAKKTLYTDRNGSSTLYELSALGQPVRVVDALGNERAMTYNDRGLETSQQDARGNLTTLDQYDDDGNLLHKTDPLNAETAYTYQGPSRLATTTVYHDGVAQTTTNGYSTDDKWNLASTTDALGKTTSYGYNAAGLVQTITRPGNSVTTFSYFDDGSVHTITDPENGVTTMTYDSAGHLQTIEDPSQNVRTLVIDAKGQLTSMTDAMQTQTAFAYDDDGNRTQVQVSAGGTTISTTTFGYDALSRLTTTTDADGNVTRQEYDAEGNVTARIDARGYRTRLSYDALGRLVETCDPLGNCTTTSYCAEIGQQPCATVDPLGNVTTIEEDELGREVARVDPLGNRTETAYDDLGRRSSVTDPAGKVTSFGYDALGRLTTVEDALLGITTYGYDDRGNRTSVQDANLHTTTFEYDLANRLTQETTPINTVTQFTYYPDGSRESKIDGKGQITTYTYNANRQLIHVDYDAQTAATFDYDERGNKTFEQNADSTRNLFYDALGRLQTVEDVDSGRTIDHVYDAVGNRTSMTVDDGDPATPPETTKYVWDGRGLLTHLTDPEGGVYRFGYDDLGRRTSATYPNGMTLQTTYDAASRVLAMVYAHPARGVIQSFTYSYDERGNRKSKTFADATAEIYDYDDLSRLTTADYPGGRHVEYVYDPVGNRQTMVEQNGSTTQTTAYAYNDFNQLLSLGPQGSPPTTTFDYDGNGNQKHKYAPDGTTTFTWDARDRLTQVDLPGDGTNIFGYDTQGLRVSMDDSQGQRRILLDGIEEYGEYDTSGGAVARYDHDPSRVDALLAQVTSQGKHHFLTDALGSVYGLTDGVGLDRARYAYDVYGARTAALEHVGTSWSFTGRKHEPAPASVTYYRAREYDTTSGFMLARDKRLVTSGEDFYAYAHANPGNVTDPTGNYVVELDGATSAAIHNPLPGGSAGPTRFLDVTLGLTNSPTGNALFQEANSSPATVLVGALLNISELITEIEAGSDPEYARLLRQAGTLVGGYTFPRINLCPTDLTGIPGVDVDVTSYWFPSHILVRNLSAGPVSFWSHAEVLGHELVHANAMLPLVLPGTAVNFGALKQAAAASTSAACATERAIHEELFGVDPDTYPGCTHN
jgi:RHS repeat-associated protein